MTDDLVKRLRLIVEKRLQCTACYKFIETADEAADHIEKLEAALREIADGSRDADKSYVSLFHEIQSEARKALEGKGD
jgi:hypothetical protein